MGWISKRTTQTGSPLHSRKGAKAKGPLRLIVGVTRFADGMFDTSAVDLECGHSGQTYTTAPEAGKSKARCAECGENEKKETK